MTEQQFALEYSKLIECFYYKWEILTAICSCDKQVSKPQ